MVLDRFWSNGPLGFPGRDGNADTAVDFAARAHRHTLRMSFKVAALASVLAVAL